MERCSQVASEAEWGISVARQGNPRARQHATSDRVSALPHCPWLFRFADQEPAAVDAPFATCPGDRSPYAGLTQSMATSSHSPPSDVCFPPSALQVNNL